MNKEREDIIKEKIRKQKKTEKKRGIVDMRREGKRQIERQASTDRI